MRKEQRIKLRKEKGKRALGKGDKKKRKWKVIKKKKMRKSIKTKEKIN